VIVSRPPSIDVIVPVHGAGHVFARCAASLVRHVDPAHHRVIVVLDGPQPAIVGATLADMAAAGLDLRVEYHDQRKGFIVSANRGIRVSNRDVVVLNSDTRVTAGWLDRLATAAYSNPAIATVTPFSNNASICSLPVSLAENTVPAGHDVDSFAALIARASEYEYPRLPTGVGMCLFIKRTALDDIGPLDEAFGLGYGEEVDFCLRASARGYVHVLDDATYIFHEGSRSFGVSSGTRIWRGEQRLRWRYPAYRSIVAEFLRRDPLAAARARVRSALGQSQLAARQEPRAMHIVHDWPPFAGAGSPVYARWLALHQSRSREVSVYARTTDVDRALGDRIEHDDHGVRVRLVVNNFTRRDVYSRAALHSARLAADFESFVEEVRPAVLHVHQLAGHCASLMGIARRRGIPIVYQPQDGWPAHAGPSIVDRVMDAARRRWLRMQLGTADHVVIGSRFMADRYEALGVLPPATPVTVLPDRAPATLADRDCAACGVPSVATIALHAEDLNAIYAKLVARASA
jgi:GT2 family glycosyltransferase